VEGERGGRSKNTLEQSRVSKREPFEIFVMGRSSPSMGIGEGFLSLGRKGEEEKGLALGGGESGGRRCSVDSGKLRKVNEEVFFGRKAEGEKLRRAERYLRFLKRPSSKKKEV